MTEPAFPIDRKDLIDGLHKGLHGIEAFGADPARLTPSEVAALTGLTRLMQPFIQRVSMQSAETVNFSVLGGHEVVYLARSNPPRFVSIG